MTCEGDCPKHVGPVIRVASGQDSRGVKWWWWYCQAAIEEDKRRGLTVEEI